MVTREELYELVWTKPMTEVAKDFDVSGSYLARICSLMNVPRPNRGYWAKLAVGKAPSRASLLEAQPGDQVTWSRDGDSSTQASTKVKPRYDATPVRPQSRKTRKVTGVHGLIRGAREHFEAGRPVDEGAYLKPYKKLLVDVTTSRGALNKCLEFANELFNALESAGHRVILAPSGEHFSRAKIDERETVHKNQNTYHSQPWSPARPTLVYIGTVPIGLAIVELSEQTLMRYVGGKYIRDVDYVPPKRGRDANVYTWTTTKEIPCGRLKLVAYCPYYKVSWAAEWKEVEGKPLEKALSAIVQAVAGSASELAGKLAEADRQAEIERLAWEAEREKQRRQQDRQQIEQSVRESHENLEQVIQQWSRLMSVEAFLAGVEQRAVNLDDLERERVLERLSLARKLLGSLNPLDFFLSWRTPAERYQPRYDHSTIT